MVNFQQNVVPTLTWLANDEYLGRMEKSTLKHSYLAHARRYEASAELNSLSKFDHHVELGSIELFAGELDPATSAVA